MGIKSTLVKPLAKYTAGSIRKWSQNAVVHQENIFKNLIKKAANTSFAKDHDFANIRTYADYTQRVPIRDYEALKTYFDRVKEGESDVLWTGKPTYFAKTSGTTSGTKYIPITKDSLPNHFGSARNMTFNYIAETGNSKFLDGKLIFLSGSPKMGMLHGIHVGRLSGISNHLIPNWLKSSQMPTYPTNCIEDWEEKLDKIVEETVQEDMRMISGIPPWVVMYYERLLDYTGKKNIIDIFPNFSLFAYGGVNFEPYRAKLEGMVGKKIDTLETYPASEGFIAFQNEQNDPALLLNANSGIFFEFVKADEFFNENPTRVSLRDVEIGVNYAIIINSNAGLWGYNIGDTVRFTSKDPYKLLVTGRIKHFISAFGEHVIGKEVEEALMTVANEEGVQIIEFTVAPQVNPPNGETPYHEWFIEFDNMPNDLDNFAQKVDTQVVRQNTYYKDLIDGNILQTLKISPLRAGAFRDYMKSKGKLGGQNKVPRLSDNRKIAEVLEGFKL